MTKSNRANLIVAGFVSLYSVCFFASSARADVLATDTWGEEATGCCGEGLGAPFQNGAAMVMYYDPLYENDYSNALFKDKFWTNADAGSDYTADSSNEPNFNAFVALLTNGVNDRIRFQTVPLKANNTIDLKLSKSNSFLESIVLANKSPGLHGIDLVGSTVTSIVTHIKDISIVNDFQSYHITAHGTYSYIGVPNPVPEPSAIVLAVCGALTLISSRRRRNAQ